MIHIVIWGKLQVLNEVLVPGRGKLIGWDVKRDFFNPLDLVPFVGPISKLNKARKVIKNRSKIKYYILGGLGLAADVFAVKEAVQWYNARYRTFEEASSSSSRSGNADVKISGGGGTKKKSRKKGRAKRYRLPVDSSRAFGRHNPCSKGYFPKKIKGRWYCVLK